MPLKHSILDHSVIKKQRKEEGFTLVELLIVLVIIGIVAAIATVSALSTRVRANESQAQASLKALASAVEIYHNTQGVYPDSLSMLGTSYIGSDLVAGQKAGYNFELESSNQGSTYTCTAVPVSQHYTGIRSFCINVLNAIQVYPDAPALSADGNNCPSGGTALTG